MLIVMAGLPGCGKSTLARLLAERLPAVVLDKDPIRRALFPAPYLEYSTEQDDFCVDVMLQAATYLFDKHPGMRVILDGRPYARRYQVKQLDRWGEEHQIPIKILECVCSDAVARERLQKDALTQSHLAENRDYKLYRQLKEQFEPIREPRLLVKTDRPLAECVDTCITYLHE